MLNLDADMGIFYSDFGEALVAQVNGAEFPFRGILHHNDHSPYEQTQEVRVGLHYATASVCLNDDDVVREAQGIRRWRVRGNPEATNDGRETQCWLEAI